MNNISNNDIICTDDEKNILIEEFNKIVFDFLGQIIKVCDNMNNDTLTNTDILKLNNIALIKKHSLINLFTKHCLKFRNKEGNFDYAIFDEFDVAKIKTKISIEAICKYRSFKILWGKLNADNKKIFNNYFKILGGIADKYNKTSNT